MHIDVLLKGLNEDLDQDLGKDMDVVFRVSGGMSAADQIGLLDLYSH